MIYNISISTLISIIHKEQKKKKKDQFGYVYVRVEIHLIGLFEPNPT